MNAQIIPAFPDPQQGVAPALRLGPRHWAREEGWGMAMGGYCFRYRPEDEEGLERVLALARESGLCIGMRGGGNSYGDAALNTQRILLDVSRMNAIKSWDAQTGIVEVEPGVTIEELWRRTLPDGWWPPVVPGTMKPTIGGCAAMNIHGKNNYAVGPFGEHILDFDLLLPDGDVVKCSPTENAELYYGAIAGFGMLGIFTRIRMKMKRIYSGLLRVEAFNTRGIAEMIDVAEARQTEEDYLVGWVDGTAGGRALGRGVVHRATHFGQGEDPQGGNSLNLAAQDLPAKIMGVFPKSQVHFLLRPFTNNLGMRAVNAVKFHAGKLMPHGHVYCQSHAAFAFLLDYIPNWRLAYRPIGLIQYQSFIPKDRAAETFNRLLKMSRDCGLPTYLAVLKKHRPDAFLMTHALDGYSLAMDFRVTPRNKKRVWGLMHRMDEIVHEAGGRFYFAKDSTLRPESVAKAWPAETLARFADLKRRCDPQNMLQSDLERRLFAERFGLSPESAP